MNRAIALAVLLLATGAASADTQCLLVSVPGIAFGSYDTLSTVPVDSLTNVRVSCERNGGPQNVTLTMRLGAGANGTSVNARRLRQLGAGTDTLAYGLYRDVSRTSVWGVSDSVDTVSQTISIAVPNKGTQTTVFTIFGRIPALQDVSAGSYADSVEITLNP